MAEEITTESVDDMLQTLQLLLLRVHVILEAADGQSITSQAMLQQLNILRKEMYRGYYVLDCFRGNQASQDDAKGQNSVTLFYPLQIQSCQASFSLYQRCWYTMRETSPASVKKLGYHHLSYE